MAVATAGYDWNHSGSSPLRSSSNTTSPMHPHRPIKPLPKRRLRARLSPEQVQSIVYPPVPQSATPLFSFPHSPAESRASLRAERRRGESDQHACHCGGQHHGEAESEDDDEHERGRPLPSSPSYDYSRSRPGKAAGAAYPKPASTASSGEESFENTNNKKKRKIPNMGGTSAHHSSLSAEMASMGISHPHDGVGIEDGDGPGRYYASAPSTPQHNAAGTGIAGAGRGRFGRSASGRTERRILHSSANLANAKANNKRPPDHGGIISTAIANAQATPPAQGNENVSLLQQEAAKTPQKTTQFTFTCGSDSASKMSWSGQQNGTYPQPPGAYPSHPQAPHAPEQSQQARPGQNPARRSAPAGATQAAHTSPSPNGVPQQPPPSTNAPPVRGSGAAPTTPAPPPRKPRRSAAKQYAIAARKRRIQQEYENFHNPPSQPWICEFCEYEDIFGEPPRALIRQYEIKDRKERKRLAEKRRLLEKARMKGRKGKKASKKAQNNAANAQHGQPPLRGGYDTHPDDVGSIIDGAPEEYYEEEYDDPPPQAPVSGKPCDHPGCHHHQHHKPQGLPPGDPRGGPRGIPSGA